LWDKNLTKKGADIKLHKPISQMTKSEITSELNALDYKDRWDESDYQYREKLVKKFYELVELEVKEGSSK
jgi:hypothetical protein